MPCERISSEDYHSEAAMRRTAKAVQELEQSEAYAAYANHLSRQETLCYAWVVAPLALFFAFYADMIVGVLDGRVFHSIFGSAVETAPYWVSFTMTATLAGYVLPLTLLAPFCGMFESVSEDEGRATFAMFAFADLLVQAFSHTSNKPASFTGHILYLVSRQGTLIGGYLVFRWRQLHWRRSFHIPWSLLLVPIAVAVFGFVWNHLTASCVTSFSASASFDEGLRRAWLSLRTLVNDDVEAIQRLFATDDFVTSLSAVAPKSALSEIWQTNFLKSWLLLLVGATMKGTHSCLQFVEDNILPRHPTTILLNGVAVVGSMLLLGAYMTPTVFFTCCTYLWHLATTDWFE